MHLFTSGESLRRDMAVEPNPEQTGDTEHGGDQLTTLLSQVLANGNTSLDDLEELAVNQALKLAQGNVSGAAKILGTTRARVAYRLSGKKVPHPAS
jgi:transcriptional regulator with GAF, ATPase, and Fis domain